MTCLRARPTHPVRSTSTSRHSVENCRSPWSRLPRSCSQAKKPRLDVAVVDADGMPVENAELAVVVVDEAILALTNYALANPLDSFYRPMPAGVDSYYGRNSIVLANAAQFDDRPFAGGGWLIGLDVADGSAMAAPMPTMAAAMPAAEAAAADMALVNVQRSGRRRSRGSAVAITVRADFNPLAVFEPAVRTDADGQRHGRISSCPTT